MEKKKRKKVIEPLKQTPDYEDQHHYGSRTAALELKRLYFVDENYEKLLVTSAGVSEGGPPARFTGQLEDVPIEGDIIRTDDNKERYIVVRRERVLYKAKSRLEKIFIVLRKIEGK